MERKVSVKVVCYSILRTTNVGDLSCSPVDYFPELQAVKRDVRDYTPAEDELAIFGGGGLLHPGLLDLLATAKGTRVAWAIFGGGGLLHPGLLDLLATAKGTRVAWGIGCNAHDQKEPNWPIFLETWPLVGLRDRDNPWEWVPCPSCMNKAFDLARTIKPTHELVVYSHYQYPIEHGDLKGAKAVPRGTNAGAWDLPSVLSFLASGRAVLTNSYHGAYWAMLLGRKVGIFEPFSNRFYHMQPQPPIITRDSHIDDFLKQAPEPYPNYLEHCRKANLAFSAKVKSLL